MQPEEVGAAEFQAFLEETDLSLRRLEQLTGVTRKTLGLYAKNGAPLIWRFVISDLRRSVLSDNSGPVSKIV